MHRKLIATLVALAATGTLVHAADPLNDTVADIGHSWAKAYYSTPDKDKDAAFAEVIASAKNATQTFPGKAEPIVWEAIALSSAAKVEGGFSALRKAREARDLLLNAESIDPTVINGAVYTPSVVCMQMCPAGQSVSVTRRRPGHTWKRRLR
jgi:hypothetical protein